MDRLVFFLPDQIGGVKTYVTNLSDFLHEKGVAHRIILYKSCDSFTTNIVHNGYMIRVHYSKYSSPAAVYKTLGKLIEKNDTIISNDTLELKMVDYLRLFNPLVFILHGDLEHYLDALEFHQHKIDQVLCVSHGLKNKYKALFPNLHFSVCHPLIANSEHTIQENNGACLRGVFIGRFELAKGADFFLETVQLCKRAPRERTMVKWQVIVSRAGTDSNLISKIPKEVEVFFDYPNKKVLEVLEQSDILLFPSRSEGFGITVLEAMKRGAIVIARHLAIGVSDMIKDHETGFFADGPADAEKLIEWLYKNPGTLAGYKWKAQQFANTAFDYISGGNNFLKYLDDACEASKRKIKKHNDVETGKIVKIFPEFLYRSLKFIHHRILYVFP